MSTLSIRLPESLHLQIKELAKKDGVSINQFVASAVAEKMSALMTVDYLYERANRGQRSKFDKVLSKVADADANIEDRI